MIVWSSGGLSLLIFAASHLVDNVLLNNYLQLSSFCLFALFLLGLFKLRDGQVVIELSAEPGESLVVHYRIDHELVNSSELTPGSVRQFKVSRMPDKSLYNNLNRKDRTIRYQDDQSQWHYLFEYKDRVIPFTEDEALRAEAFLITHVAEEGLLDSP